jgi:hypothetical protein
VDPLRAARYHECRDVDADREIGTPSADQLAALAPDQVVAVADGDQAGRARGC